MRKIICGAIMLATVFTAGAQVQMEHWLRAPQELSVYSPTGGALNVTVANGASAGNKGYNSIYENGSPLFYIADSKVYGVKNGVHNLIASLNPPGGGITGHEFGIIPHPQNNILLCSSKKFFIIYSVKNGNNQGQTRVAEIDMNANNGAGALNPLYDVLMGDNDLLTTPMAISRVRPNGDRMIYFQGKNTGAPGSGLRIYKMDANGAFSPFGTGASSGVGNPATKEMELNNAGNQLAYVGTDGKIHLVAINSSTGLPPGAETILTVTNPGGLEFDNTGNFLYYSDNAGVWKKALTGSPSGPIGITGSSPYANGSLEKSFSDVYHSTQILCGNSTNIQGIDLVSNSVTMWIASFNATYMPDQIDGEYANANLVNVSAPYHICNGTAGALNVTLSPVLTAGGYTMEILIGNGVYASYPCANGTYPLPGQTANLGYSLKVYKNTNPSCAIFKNWTIHVTTCGISPAVVVTSTPHTTVYYKLSAQPDDNPVDGSNWYVSELDKETNAEIFNINNPPCWQQLSTTDANTFRGFAPTLENNYSGEITDIPCPNEDGLFLYDRTYKITRETWIGSDPHEFYSVIVRNGQIIEPEGSSPEKSLGIETVTENAMVSIFPNPSNGIFTVTLAEGTDKASVEVYNDLGVLVMSSEQTTANAEMDLSKMPKGIYLVKINSAGNNITRKIVLE